MNKSRWLALGLGLVIVLLLALLRADDGVIPQTVRNLTFDQYQRLLPRQKASQPVRVIDIDETSLAKIGQFPWPRSEFAKLVDELNNLGAAAIVFDIVFSEPDRLSPNRVLAREDLQKWLNKTVQNNTRLTLPDNDVLFAKAIKQAPVILSFGVNKDAALDKPALKSGYAIKGNSTLKALNSFQRVTNLVPVLEEAASGIGSISVSPNTGLDVIRAYPLMWAKGDKPYPSLVMESLRVAQGASTFIIQGAAHEKQIIQSIRIGAITVPTTRAGEMWMYYAKPDPDLYVSAYKLLRGNEKTKQALRQKLQGHIVFIGTSATGLFDIKNTPLGDSVPGVSVHAQALDQILSQTFLWRPDWADGVEVLLVLVIGVFIVLAAVFLSPGKSLLLGGVWVIALIAGSWIAFKNYHMLFDATYPLIAGLLVHFAMTAYRFLVTDRQARYVRTAFSRYVSPDVLKDIEKHPTSLKLGGDTRELTIMFVDIRNFTPLSEGLTPQELVAFLNKLLGDLSACVTQEKGTIDKYIGDSIMAFWNAPLEIKDHEKRAVKAALQMRKTLEELNRNDAFGFRKNRYGFDDIAIGIGINTGQACVGNLGSQERFDYSIVGDAVNVAARVESTCKAVGVDILVSASTAKAVEDFALLDAGELALKGKSEKQKLFTVVGDKTLKTKQAFIDLTKEHEAAIATRTKKKKRSLFEQAKKRSREVSPYLVNFYDKLIERI